MFLSRLMLAAIAGVAAAGGAAAAPDWSAIPAKTVTLFAPGQSSLEWAMTKTSHRGAVKFAKGKSCAACHIGEEKPMGDVIASGKKLEPKPIPGKPGSLDAKVQVARDAQKLYVRLEFSDAGQPDAGMSRDAAKVAMMLDGGNPEVARAGCWAMCHNDSYGMGGTGPARSMYLATPADGVSEYWEAALNDGAAPVAKSGTFADRRRDSRPSAVEAEAAHKNGVWTVTLSRPLAAGTVGLKPGKRYTVAFAIEAGHTAGRFHYVSFERTLVLGQGAADFIAP